MKRLALLLLIIAFCGCGKKKISKISEVVKVPKVGKVDLLPSVVNVKYREGSSGVKSCRRCHTAIYDEWKDSFHSQSTVSELFYTTSDKYKFEECMGCHSPVMVRAGIKRPHARNWLVHEGITCSACHVHGNKTRGPLGSNAPHGSRKDSYYRKSDICASCHQTTFAEWQNSGYQKQNTTCQVCHMPQLKRHVANYSKHLYSAKHVRSHKLKIPSEKIVELQIGVSKLMGQQLFVDLKNIGSGHALPTGIYGDATVFVELRIFDGDKLVFFREEKLTAVAKNSIKPGESRRFLYNFKPRVARSHLAVAKVFLTSSNYSDDLKLAETKRYCFAP